MIDNVSASNHSFQYLLISFWSVTVVGYLGLLTICSRIHRSIDSDLHGQKGEIEISPCEGENSLLLHGPLRAAESGSYLEHVDGTPFFWLGDTWWYGLIGEFRWPEEFRTATADRVAKGFNVIQVVAGFLPGMPVGNPRGGNEAGMPWEKEYARINSRFFDLVDLRIDYLVRNKIVPCIVGSWGYYLLDMGVKKYIASRFGPEFIPEPGESLSVSL